MTHLTPLPEAAHLFREFEHTAWRLETRCSYATERSGPGWQSRMNGAGTAPDPEVAWRENVRTQTATGKRVERVRILDDPLTDGQRYLLATAPEAIAAGEDIRILGRAEAKRLELPSVDFWIFDSRVLMVFHFDQNDAVLGVELSEEPERVLIACQARDAAWHHARSPRG